MTTIVTLLIVILFLAFVFFKTKGDRKKGGLFHNDGPRKTFKDFQKEQLEQDPNGIYGEAAAVSAMAKIFKDRNQPFALLRNLYIPCKNGYTEIDALLIHSSGIFVLESKNISGEISGSLEDQRWTQRLNARIQHTFHNPILQNASHIREMGKFLKTKFPASEISIDSIPFFSIIVFSDRCVLKQVPAKGSHWFVMHLFQMEQKIQNILSTQDSILDIDTLEKICRALEPCTQADEKIKAEHRNYIRKNFPSD